MINDLISNISFFGIFLTGMIYIIAIVLQSKLKSSLLNPLMISCIIIIVLLLVTGIDYDVYMFGKVKPDGTYDGTGAAFFQNMLTPTTVCLAIPLYEKLVYLKKYPVAILGSIFIGALSCVALVLAMSLLFGLNQQQYITLLPKSITTAIGMGLSEELGGMVSVTIASIIISGVTGNMLASVVFKVFRIVDPIAQGLACGTASHAIGTAKAREFGDIQEAMSGLSIAVCGILTVVLASVFAGIPMG